MKPAGSGMKASGKSLLHLWWPFTAGLRGERSSWTMVRRNSTLPIKQQPASRKSTRNYLSWPSVLQT